MNTDEFPITKFGSKWVCDGPNGRFSAHTKAEAIRLLNETGGVYDDKVAAVNEARNMRGRRSAAVVQQAAQPTHQSEDEGASPIQRLHSCPECNTEMLVGEDGFLFHAESTDCAPDPWPTSDGR